MHMGHGVQALDGIRVDFDLFMFGVNPAQGLAIPDDFLLGSIPKKRGLGIQLVPPSWDGLTFFAWLLGGNYQERLFLSMGYLVGENEGWSRQERNYQEAPFCKGGPACHPPADA